MSTGGGVKRIAQPNSPNARAKHKLQMGPLNTNAGQFGSWRAAIDNPERSKILAEGLLFKILKPLKTGPILLTARLITDVSPARF